MGYRSQANGLYTWLRVVLLVAGLAAALSSPDVYGQDRGPVSPAKQRKFVFNYDVQVTGLSGGDRVRCWLPIPSSNEDQLVRIARLESPPHARTTIGTEPKYGNGILYIEATAQDSSPLATQASYQVTRFEVRADAKSDSVSRQEMEQFLLPDLKVPVGGKSLSLLEGKTLPSDQLRLGRLLYDAVNAYMTYSKQGTGWGQGDSEWACDSRYGNCSDFHSLFISMARANQMPAKFEMGFPLPSERGSGEIPGYHCWAKFKPVGRGWIPVDISEANKVKEKDPGMVEYYFGNLTENRVAFTVGRDLKLVPPQDGPPLNFLVYPYVEVNGKPYPGDKVERKFTYRDSIDP